MPKSHRRYPAEFRQRIVELVRKGRTPEELGRQFEPSAQAIRNWAESSVCLFSEVPESGSGPLRHVKSKPEDYIVPTGSTAIHPSRHWG